jgi:hypothetical protein
MKTPDSSAMTSLLSTSFTPGADQGAALEGRLDLVLHLQGAGVRRQGDSVRHPVHTREVAHRPVRRILLVVPVDRALQRDPAVGHGDRYPVVRYRRVPLQRVQRRQSEIRVVTHGGRGEFHREIVRHPVYPQHPLGRSLRRPLVRVTLHVAGEGYHPIDGAHADFAGMQARLPLQLVLHYPLQLARGFHSDLQAMGTCGPAALRGRAVTDAPIPGLLPRFASRCIPTPPRGSGRTPSPACARPRAAPAALP